MAMSADEAMRPAAGWRQQAKLFAGAITAVLAGLALVVVQGTRLGRRRIALVAADRAILAASNRQRSVAMALSAARAEILEVRSAGMSDRVALIDVGCTPIVALTSDAGPPEEALARPVGTDGAAGKPMNRSDLRDVLGVHVRARPAGCIRTVASPPPVADRETPGPGPFGTDALRIVPILAADRIRELRTNLGSDVFANLIEQCLVEMDPRLRALNEALVSGALPAVRAHAHALVGMAAGYGMAAMEVRLRTIMAAARDGDLAPLGAGLTEALENDFTEVAGTLRAMVRRDVA